MENWNIRIRDCGYKSTREVYIYRRGINGQIEYLQGDGIIKCFSEGSAIDVKPVIELTPEMMQALSDELSSIGYKPQKGFLEGKIQATENHLDDMRKLVFKIK